MITGKLLRAIGEIQQIRRLATVYPGSVRIHPDDGNIVIDAKSYTGMYAVSFRKPTCIVAEPKEFHRAIRDIGETLQG